MNPYLDDGDVRLYHGDCTTIMPSLGLVDAIVTDPPYGLGFMGKDWDSPGGTGDFPMRRTTEANTVNTGVTRQGGRQRSCSDFAHRQARDARSFQEWCESWAVVALDVLKPGGHIVAFGGTRTYHRLASALEDAGFEIRDCLSWMYGSGFPKSLDVSKAIDAAAGADRRVVAPDPEAARRNRSTPQFGGQSMHEYDPGYDGPLGRMAVTAPATPEAAEWDGWGTALKPAWEPIILARKPLTGTVAANVAAHGTGALNIDACRIGEDKNWPVSRAYSSGNMALSGNREHGANPVTQDAGDPSGGRWPANVVLDEDAAQLLDAQSGERTSPTTYTRSVRAEGEWLHAKEAGSTQVGFGDSGGASRFFYTAKASRSERNDGIHDLPLKDGRTLEGGHIVSDGRTADKRGGPSMNHHPTVKPVALMRWLVRLVTPPGGLVLDPFVGSGSTLVACRAEGIRGVGIDRELDYLKIAAGRLSQLSLLS